MTSVFKENSLPKCLLWSNCNKMFLFFRHITSATLSILKGETVPLDVLQIKVNLTGILKENLIFDSIDYFHSFTQS